MEELTATLMFVGFLILFSLGINSYMSNNSEIQHQRKLELIEACKDTPNIRPCVGVNE